jgi:hypothetical protein
MHLSIGPGSTSEKIHNSLAIKHQLAINSSTGLNGSDYHQACHDAHATSWKLLLEFQLMKLEKIPCCEAIEH